jgi:hypothetical protein
LVDLYRMGCCIWYVRRQYSAYVVWIIISGDLFFLQLLGQEVMVINSQDIAEALMEKRSRIYSDCPYLATRQPYILLAFFHSVIVEYRQVWLVGSVHICRLWWRMASFTTTLPPNFPSQLCTQVSSNADQVGSWVGHQPNWWPSTLLFSLRNVSQCISKHRIIINLIVDSRHQLPCLW